MVDTEEVLTQNEIAKLTEAFGIWDKGEQGYIKFDPDFQLLWRSIGQNPTKAELNTIISENDGGGTGHFNLNAFLKICENPKYMKDAIRPEHLIDAFKAFDKDAKGTLTVGQLRYMMQHLGDKLDDEEADGFIAFVVKECKPEDSDQIPYEEIVDKLFLRDPGLVA
mmetsp:Transcript_15964/g.34556  ORF Transcript_15964/g.34556 Transcript_15964/m.34556 type:complete len:166 (-) Transcript_15964:406-903(-)|eukprot:CAMPEP_0206555080 /NCGR_PEP_ID=MMETSP0325_2-20121206/17569_1 /ASSEMBLY_ACC=CAM_ASM_000347 /TAXON_ID=2866 /ORGANISM="Crypthecodinium cohnii, Strain Seligo" /LENGTH=165 /DNA_ID=CAMNT_0054055289 /DNA_START=47 /DNA_END=544 /DNA_ORIENTATION=+